MHDISTPPPLSLSGSLFPSAEHVNKQNKPLLQPRPVLDGPCCRIQFPLEAFLVLRGFACDLLRAQELGPESLHLKQKRKTSGRAGGRASDTFRYVFHIFRSTFSSGILPLPILKNKKKRANEWHILASLWFVTFYILRHYFTRERF